MPNPPRGEISSIQNILWEDYEEWLLRAVKEHGINAQILSQKQIASSLREYEYQRDGQTKFAYELTLASGDDYSIFVFTSMKKISADDTMKYFEEGIKPTNPPRGENVYAVYLKGCLSPTLDSMHSSYERKTILAGEYAKVWEHSDREEAEDYANERRNEGYHARIVAESNPPRGRRECEARGGTFRSGRCIIRKR